jgi:conjugal transfer mating pair stabilization protein TraG
MVWAVPVFFGAILYLALFVPKGNITVYDPVLNRFQTIGQVPDAVVFTAGFLNKIERGMSI